MNNKPSIKRVCVYAASSQLIHQQYFDESKLLGKILAQNNIEVQYGGGYTGCMGALADSMLEHNGSIIGVLPKFMDDSKWGHTKVKMILVDNMHQRKQRMVKDVDAVIALPGGVGTLEELMEVISWKQLGQFSKPIIILNVRGIYDHLIEHMKFLIKEGFLDEKCAKLWTVVTSAKDVLHAIETASESSKDVSKESFESLKKMRGIQ